jgi:membrane protease YdiL (CAAX protease family)
MIGQVSIILIFLILYSRRRLFQNKEKREFFFYIYEMLNDVKISLKNPLNTILFPIISMTIAFSVMWVLGFINTMQIVLNFLTGIFVFLLTVILAPLSEEILQCLFLSLIFVSIPKICHKFERVITKFQFYSIFLLFLVIDAFFMALLHNNYTSTSFLVRTLGFIFFGLLYVKNERNIVPPVIAHATWNLSLLIISFYNLS